MSPRHNAAIDWCGWCGWVHNFHGMSHFSGYTRPVIWDNNIRAYCLVHRYDYPTHARQTNPVTILGYTVASLSTTPNPIVEKLGVCAYANLYMNIAYPNYAECYVDVTGLLSDHSIVQITLWLAATRNYFGFLDENTCWYIRIRKMHTSVCIRISKTHPFHIWIQSVDVSWKLHNIRQQHAYRANLHPNDQPHAA